MQVERWPRSVSFITERFKFFHAVGEYYSAPSSVSLFARHLLPYRRRLLLSCSLIALDRSCPLSQSATPDSRTQPCPAARPKGKNEESPGWSLLRTERFKFFHATGGRVARATPSFIQAAFTSQTGSLILSLYAPRYCLTASAGFGRQFAKLRALSRLRRRYDSRKNRPFLRSLPPPVPLVLYAMLTLSLPPPST